MKKKKTQNKTKKNKRKYAKKPKKNPNTLLVNIKSKLMLLLYANYILPCQNNIILVSVDIF